MIFGTPSKSTKDLLLEGVPKNIPKNTKNRKKLPKGAKRDVPNGSEPEGTLLARALRRARLRHKPQQQKGPPKNGRPLSAYRPSPSRRRLLRWPRSPQD